MELIDLETLLSQAVQEQIPKQDFGIFLSSGVDSTLLVALAKKYRKNFYTFTIAVEGNLDESKAAKKTAKFFGTKHYELKITEKIFYDNLDSFIKAMDQPTGDGINTFFASKLASQHCKVVLSGIGGDELFFGYRYMREIKNIKKIQGYCFGNLFLKTLILLRNTPKWDGIIYKIGLGALRFFKNYKEFDYHKMRSLNNQESEETLDTTSHQFWSQLRKLEINFYLKNQLLPDADTFSMAHSLELRVPFLSKKVIESIVINNYIAKEKTIGEKKELIKIIKKHYPDFEHATKKGFELPIGEWLSREIDLHKLAISNFPLVTTKTKQQITKDFEKKSLNYTAFWNLLTLSKWYNLNT